MRLLVHCVLIALLSIATADEECGKANPVRSRRGHRADNLQDFVNNYIIGGRKAIPGEFPWQVGLKNFASPYLFSFCGGVVWNKNYILTAAHCIVKCEAGRIKPPTRIQYCIGDYNKKSSDGENCYNAVHWWINSGYNPCAKNIKNDIGILKMRHPLEVPKLTDNGYGSVNTACHPENKEYVGSAVISGWGRDDPRTKSTPDVLKALNVPIWDQRSCRRIWNVDESQICVGGDDGQSPCQGDSGGPLVHYENGVATVIGLTSYGPVNCAIRGIPTVFTRISYFLPWIESITNSTSSK